MDGSEKIEATIIGKTMQPGCFKNANILSLNCRYYANKKTWMNREVFSDWLKIFNLKMHER
jgi:hypothetical protein